MYGYKARSLKALEEKGLPTLVWSSHDHIEDACHRATEYSRLFQGRWAIRVDRPQNDGRILPLFGSNKGTEFTSLHKHLNTSKYDFPDCTFVVSEAPDDTTRDSNIVCWMDGDEMLFEIGFQPMTLRDAWTKGKLYYGAVDGGVGDYLRNTNLLCPHALLTVIRIEYLRRIRKMTQTFVGEDFEVSVNHTGRIIFWQSIHIKDKREYIVFRHS